MHAWLQKNDEAEVILLFILKRIVYNKQGRGENMKDLIYIVMIVFFFFFMFLMSYAFIYGNRDRLKQWLTKVATHQHFPRINTVGGIIAVLLIMFAVSRMVFL